MSNHPEQNRRSDVTEPTWLRDLRVKRASPTPGSRDAYQELRRRLQQRLLATFQPAPDAVSAAEARSLLQEKLDQLLAEEKVVLTRDEKRQLFEAIFADVFGLGPLEALLALDGVTEIMVNGHQNVFIARDHRLERADVAFEDESHLLRVAQRLVAAAGQQLDEETPLVDARLPDGSYVNAVAPPVALTGTTLTVRRAVRTTISMDKLIEQDTLTQEAFTFLRACVQARFNILICGGAHAGKTTLLNALAQFIPEHERIITVEDEAELALQRPHVVSLEARAAVGPEGQAITMPMLVRNALRMRPDRLLVGELQGAEAWELLQAIGNGQDGCLSTVHATSARETLSRLEMLVLLADVHLPLPTLREFVATAVNLIVHVERLRDGTHKVMSISEVQGLENEAISLSEIFRFEQIGIDNGTVLGRLQPTGTRPKSMWKIRDAGIVLSPSIFSAKRRR